MRGQVKGTLLLFLKLSLLTCDAVVFLTIPPVLQRWGIADDHTTAHAHRCFRSFFTDSLKYL